MKELEIKLFGKVQGVGLRRRIVQLATEDGRDIVGYVQNNPDGSVEIIAQGSLEDLQEFLLQVKQGTVYSDITDIATIWHDRPQDTFTEFEKW